MNTQQSVVLNGLRASALLFQQLKGSHLVIQRSFALRGYDFEEVPDEIMVATLCEPFFTSTIELLSEPDGFMLFGKLGVDFFSFPEMLYPIKEENLRLIRAQLFFSWVVATPTLVFPFLIVRFALVVLFSRMITIRKQKWTCFHMIPWSAVSWRLFQSRLSSLPNKTSSVKKTFTTKFKIVKLPLQWTDSALTGLHTENPFRYQQFDLRHIKIFRRAQLIVEFDAADNFRLYVTTVKAINFQDDIPSFLMNNFANHYALVFDSTSIEDCRYPELVERPLRLELNFNFPLKHVTEFIVSGERTSSVNVDKFGVDGKII